MSAPHAWTIVVGPDGSLYRVCSVCGRVENRPPFMSSEWYPARGDKEPNGCEAAPVDTIAARDATILPSPPICPDHPQPKVGETCPVCDRETTIAELREEIRRLVRLAWR